MRARVRVFRRQLVGTRYRCGRIIVSGGLLDPYTVSEALPLAYMSPGTGRSFIATMKNFMNF